MAPKGKSSQRCAVCKEGQTKYRCPSCVVRYCSVGCFKKHKAEQHPDAPVPLPDEPSAAPVGDVTRLTVITPLGPTPAPAPPLRPLTSLKWPPDPDPSIFTDPLRKEDPKPLRHSELLRIATSPDLRSLLTSTSLPSILRLLDRLPTPAIRSMALARCLGLDDAALSKPGETIVGGRDSPPPLDSLLEALAARGKGHSGGSDGREEGEGEGEGWYLHLPDNSERIWIGREERRVMRLWADVVCQAIDGDGEGGAGWGSGDLAWEV